MITNSNIRPYPVSALVIALCAALLALALAFSTVGTAYTDQRYLPAYLLPRMALMSIVAAILLSFEFPLRGIRVTLGFPAAALIFWTMPYLPQAQLTLIGGTILALLVHVLRPTLLSGRFVLKQHVRRIIQSATTGAQLVLTVSAMEVAVRVTGGSPLLTAIRIADLPVVIPSIALGIAVYGAVRGLLLYARKEPIQEVAIANLPAITLLSAAPLPLTIGSAIAFNNGQAVLFLILFTALLIQVVWSAQSAYAQQRYRQQLVEVQSMTGVNRAVQNDLQTDALLNAVYIQITTALNVADVTIALYDAHLKEVRFPIVVKRSRRIERNPQSLDDLLTDDLIAQVITSRRPLVLNDSKNEAWLGVPLNSGDEILGVMTVSRAISQPFTDQEAGLLTSIAAQVSVGVENALLNAESERDAIQLQTLNRLSVQISGSLDMRETAEQILRATIELTGAEAAALFFYADMPSGTRQLRLARKTAHFANTGFVPAPTSQADTRQAVAITPSALIVDTPTANYPPWIRQWVELPIRDGDRPLGVIMAYYDKSMPLRPEDLELYQTFASQAGLVIANAQLYAQVQESLSRSQAQLDSLGDMNRELSAVYSLNTLFDIVLKRSIAATRAHAGLILFAEDNADTRITARRIDTDDATAEPIAAALFRRVSWIGGHIIDTVLPENAWQELTNDGLTRLAVPIMKDYDTVGLIVLESRIANAFSADSIQFMRQLAAQASIAIYNVQMIGWMQDGSERLTAILESMHDAVIVIGIDGRIALANDRCERLLGLKSKMITTDTVQRLLAQHEILFAEKLGFDREMLDRAFSQKSSNPQTLLDLPRHAYTLTTEFDKYGDQPMQQRFIERVIVPVYSTGRLNGLLMVFSDATERNQLEQAREDLSRMVVHDLRGPLTAISTGIKLLEELSRRNALSFNNVEQMTDVSQRAIRKMLTLINSLLDISKMESGTLALEREPSPFAPIAEAVQKEMSPLAEELDIHFTVEIPEALPAVRIDGEKIERVLINLVDNALKYTPMEGHVTIRACVHDPDHVRIEVSDTGPGIVDADKPRVFDRYQQVDSQKSHRRGTGLGLTFCRMAVEAHGGKIWIEDNTPRGSIFAFTLPTAAHIG